MTFFILKLKILIKFLIGEIIEENHIDINFVNIKNVEKMSLWN